MTKQEILETIDAVQTTNARNFMGCSENWYNPYWAIKQTFTQEELHSFSKNTLLALVKLGTTIGEGLY